MIWLIQVLKLIYHKEDRVLPSRRMLMILLTTLLIGGFTGLKLARIPILFIMMFISWLVLISTCPLTNGHDHWCKVRASNQMITNTMIGRETDGSSTHEVRNRSHHHMIQSGTRKMTSGIQFINQLNQRSRLLRRLMITSTMTGQEIGGSSTHEVRSHSHHLMIPNGIKRMTFGTVSTSQLSQLSHWFRKVKSLKMMKLC